MTRFIIAKKFGTIALVIVILSCLALLTGCKDADPNSPCVPYGKLGFFWGLLHGFISPFNLIALLVRDDIMVFAKNNNGAWYAFGFILGNSVWGFLIGQASSYIALNRWIKREAKLKKRELRKKEKMAEVKTDAFSSMTG